MMCRRVRRELAGFISKSLDEARRRAVSEHLRMCPDCAGEERRLRSVVGVLGRVQTEGPSPLLLRATRSKLAAVRGELLAGGQGLARKAWHLSPAALVGVIALLVASGLLMAHSSTSGQKARELRELQQRIQGEGLLRQAHLLQREMPQLADQMILAGVELLLREVSNLDPRSHGEEGIREMQQRLATTNVVESLTSLVRRSEGREKKTLAKMLLAIRQIEMF